MKVRIIIAALAIPFLASSAFSAETKDDFVEALDGVIRERCINHDKLGVRVVEIPSGETLYDKNGSSPLSPASVMKLVTTATALHYLGVNYKFKTDVYHTGSRDGGVVKGDLVIKGGGDPKLTSEAVWLIAEEVRRQGITDVTGDLVLDVSFFDDNDNPPARNGKRTQRPYDALLGALSVNFNTVAVHVYPGVKAGDPVIAEAVPSSPYFRMINDGVTRNGDHPVAAFRVNGQENVVIRITGSMRPDEPGGAININVDDPLRFAGETFRAYLKRSGVNIAGVIKKGLVPSNARLIHTYQSEPLSMILRDLNRFSNNFVAEQIVKTVAAEVTGAPGSHENGLSLAMKFLSESGVDTTGVVLADGSGLSKDNRLTAKTLSGLLVAMSRRFDVGPDFIASLGIMGVDGTVRKRLKTSPAKSLARAKTGTINHVTALAGYVSGQDGKLYGFTILQNDSGCPYRGSHKIEDRIVTTVHLLAGKKR
ncbi:MAG: D-alanyl-D-alanine carboxypeptidase/D-alanyl-D-alanine-endopeptidase [Nitrospinae bacterium]|nr:D-alanyl-D-alanine carboxypeptidase/D-alanyl-D-alanine-endopeptidase [Nitrospinota bacterium]MBF0634529.1 D-alanyl-D-alanine carboxypeptidase/D-alanyl-D-alanine-endopeptidase [Nitrospinota bacterium]